MEPLLCGVDRTNADDRVRKTEVHLENWKKRVTELRSQYDWLLFFSIQKILRLYKLVSVCEERDKQLDKIVAEISFLCKNDVATRQNLKQRVKVGVHVCCAYVYTSKCFSAEMLSSRSASMTYTKL